MCLIAIRQMMDKMIEEWTHTEVRLTKELSTVRQQLAEVTDERDVLKSELISMAVCCFGHVKA